ncbi:Zinc finger, U1-type [Corchorus olitorius]|uniref:Zinc finger, U1-type n=1 Tax=Corchorus olitorius TaxID=93759 RepID=A0A1R3INF6_9ROSI|nr:Zinc finger, U1-type [Corchorus olitorius]
MSQPQQQQQSSFTYFAHPTNPISYSTLPFPQPPTYPPQPLLFPPGTDPYVQSSPYTLTHVEYEAQVQFYVDPDVGSRSGITTQVAPIGCDTSLNYCVTFVRLSGMGCFVSALISFPIKVLQSSVAALNSSGNNNKMNQGSVRCEVCNIGCDTQDVYQKHLMGKKHQKNIQPKTNLGAAGLPETSNITVLGVTNVQELEKNKQKLVNARAAVDSVRMCTICNVTCNSHEAFTSHLSGRRHAAQAGLIAIDGVGPYLAAVRANDHFWSEGKKTTNANRLTWCEVCKTSCHSNDYAKHLSGRKHQKKLENLKNGISNPSVINTPAATNLTIGPVENPAPKNSSGDNAQKSEKRAAQSDAPKEDLETKKRKVMEGGAAVAAIRVCTICNVVCNSEKVFKYHLSGQKHAAMVKKQTDARISATPTITTV